MAYIHGPTSPEPPPRHRSAAAPPSAAAPRIYSPPRKSPSIDARSSRPKSPWCCLPICRHSLRWSSPAAARSRGPDGPSHKIHGIEAIPPGQGGTDCLAYILTGSAEWTDENTRIIVELFVKQVKAGNMPNTHLTPSAYDEVGKEFLMRTGLEYTPKQDLPGCGKFKKHGLRNEEGLRVLFEDISVDGTDHWNPASGLPPPSSSALKIALNVDEIADLDLEDDSEEQPSPTVASSSKVRLGVTIPEKNKKSKTSQVMQEEIRKISSIAQASHTSFQSFLQKDETISVASTMDLVRACGATDDTDEHFIATELFLKREQREMFLHMTSDSQKGWLRRRFDLKYGN
ncbi:uncharacterized protein LOC119299825 [Triticum dicoccoides]|uniref:uncharacterized protein LOC119299825 n=1 Tax=Triticum dicoccoides TaxID=85692 RepID=UPI00188DCEB7|nr:uncharacterized protein LOC119299825 [Triticum dicoccoides]